MSLKNEVTKALNFSCPAVSQICIWTWFWSWVRMGIGGLVVEYSMW